MTMSIALPAATPTFHANQAPSPLDARRRTVGEARLHVLPSPPGTSEVGVPMTVHASDPVTRAGLASQLREHSDLLVLDDASDARIQVALVAVDDVDTAAVAIVRQFAARGVRVVIVATRLDNAGLMAAVEAGIAGLLRRAEAVTATLAAAVTAAATGNGTIPPDLLGKLLDQMGWLQRQVLAPRGLSMNGLAERELSVLRLVADGYDTQEIAKALSYSERTVKNVIHDITVRLNLRNRSHAVAHAIRHGLI